MGRLRRLLRYLAIYSAVLLAFVLTWTIVRDNYSYRGQSSFGMRTHLKKLISPRIVCNVENMVQRLFTDFDNNKQLLELTCDDDTVSRLEYGGLYKPSNCVSREMTAIIIPYRDRPEHLEILLNYLHKFLQQQDINYGIYVVEMALPTQFNRGLLANAGFLTARSITNYTCYIIHDVDLLPTNPNNVYTCGAGPVSLITNCTKYEKGLPYPYYVGGVLGMTPAQFVAVNGYSNLYFGWGGEDDDMLKRINVSKLKLERPAKHIGTYTNLNHTNDSSNPENPHKPVLLKTAEKRMFSDGLSSIEFQRQSLEFRQKYTRVLIKVDESEIMKEFPWVKAVNTNLLKGKNENKNTKVESVIRKQVAPVKMRAMTEDRVVYTINRHRANSVVMHNRQAPSNSRLSLLKGTVDNKRQEVKKDRPSRW